LRQIISGFTELIFTKFSPCARYLIVDNWSDLLFPITQGMLPWQPILGPKSAKLAYSLLAFILRPEIPKQIGMSPFRFQKIQRQWFLYIVCRLNLVIGLFCEFTSGNGVYPLVNQQFSYVRLAAPMLDTVAISTEFCGAISSTQFCFTYSPGASLLCRVGYMIDYAALFGRPYYRSCLWYSVSSVVCLSSVVCDVLYCGKTVRPSEKLSEGVNRKPGSSLPLHSTYRAGH